MWSGFTTVRPSAADTGWVYIWLSLHFHSKIYLNGWWAGCHVGFKQLRNPSDHVMGQFHLYRHTYSINSRSPYSVEMFLIRWGIWIECDTHVRITIITQWQLIFMSSVSWIIHFYGYTHNTKLGLVWLLLIMMAKCMTTWLIQVNSYVECTLF